MASHPPALGYTDLELRSYLPSGWNLLPGASGAWHADRGSWQIDVYDGADNSWTISVAGDEATASGRLEALKAAIDRLDRKALGRKSILTG